MVEGNRGGEGRGTGARGSDFVVVRIENSIKFRLGVDLTPPQPDSSVFFKISKRGVVGGGKDDGRGWEGRGGLAEEGES